MEKPPEFIQTLSGEELAKEHYTPSLEQKRRLEVFKEVIDSFEEEHIHYSVMGGYGLDGLYGELTRDHGDIDLIIDNEEVDKARDLLNNIGFEKKEVKDSGVEVYFHESSNTKLEFGKAAVLEQYNEGDKQLFFPEQANAVLDSRLFRTATLEGHKKMDAIQDERAIKAGWGEYPYKEHKKSLMKKIEEAQKEEH